MERFSFRVFWIAILGVNVMASLAHGDVDLKAEPFDPSAVRVLEENAALNRHMAEDMHEKGLKISEERFRSHAQEREEHANTLRAILTNGASAADNEEAEKLAEELRPQYRKKSK